MKKFFIVGLVMSVFAGNSMAAKVASGAAAVGAPELFCTTDSNCDVGSKCVNGKCSVNARAVNPLVPKEKAIKSSSKNGL